MGHFDGNFETTLDCGHVVVTKYLAPQSEKYCPRHGRIAKVTSCSKKYTWRCMTCLATRSYISTRLKGEGFAMKHHRKDRTHHVIYTDMDGKVLWDSHPSAIVQSPLF